MTRGFILVLLATMLFTVQAFADGPRFDAALDGSWTFCQEGARECREGDGCDRKLQASPRTVPPNAWADGGFVYTVTGADCPTVIGTYRCNKGYLPNFAIESCL